MLSLYSCNKGEKDVECKYDIILWPVEITMDKKQCVSLCIVESSVAVNNIQLSRLTM